jgi:hypothetical protein
MSHTHSLADTIGYSRALVRAGVTGFQSAQSTSQHLALNLVEAASAGLKAAAVGGGIALLGCKLRRRRAGVGQTALTLASIAFCAEFLWRSRKVQSVVMSRVRREISNARDQHWLELNPVDYA